MVTDERFRNIDFVFGCLLLVLDLVLGVVSHLHPHHVRQLRLDMRGHVGPCICNRSVYGSSIQSLFSSYQRPTEGQIQVEVIGLHPEVLSGGRRPCLFVRRGVGEVSAGVKGVGPLNVDFDPLLE